MEGESFAVLGGFFAHQKTLTLNHVLLAAGAGSALGDMALYFMGRLAGSSAYVQKLERRPLYGRAMKLIRQNETLFVLTNRFIYGVRGVGGVAIGVAGVAPLKFMVLNAISALVWTSIFVGAGYFFGASVELAVGRAIHGHERMLIALALFAAVVIAAFLAARRYKRKHSAADELL